MARVFEVVLKSFGDIDRSSVGSLLKAVAMMITGRMGGTSGPIWERRLACRRRHGRQDHARAR